MKNFCIIVYVIMIFFLSILYCYSNEIGIITYIEGEVCVTRDEEELDGLDIEEDMSLENYDVIKTGEDGIVEMDITTKQGRNMIITVDSDTVFSIEIDNYEEIINTTFEMFAGSLALKLNRLVDNESVSVMTESASMGVRGTTFEVASEVTGDLLVTCEEGEVMCTDDDGEEQIITPGYIVEKKPGEKIRSNQLKKKDLKNFRKEWREKRREEFKNNGLPSFRRYAKKFNRLHIVMLKLAGELKKQNDIIKQWAKFAKNRKKPPKKKLIQEIKKIEPILVEMKKVMNVFERVVVQLQLMEPYHNKGILKGDMIKGVRVKQFYKQMRKKVREIKQIFRRTRRVIKLFTIMNNGHFPRHKARIKFDTNFEQYNPVFK